VSSLKWKPALLSAKFGWWPFGGHPLSGGVEACRSAGFGWCSFGKPSVEWRHRWTSGLMAATGHGLVRVDAWSNGCDRCLRLVGGHFMRVLAATSSYCIKGTVGWRRRRSRKDKEERTRRQVEGQIEKGQVEEQEEGTYCRLIASLF
jgi:hypothetical protein